MRLKLILLVKFSASLAALGAAGADSQVPVNEDVAHEGHTNHFARAPYLQLATPHSMTVVWRTDGAITPVVRYGPTVEYLDAVVAATSIVTRVALPTNKAEVKILQDTHPGLFRLPQLHSAPAKVFQYEASITGLMPNTQYYYAVYDGDRRLTEADPSYRFVTHPPRDEAKPVRFWVVGDSGTGREAQHAVHTSMLHWLKEDNRPLDFCLHLGNMAFDRGRDVEFQSRFFEMYEPTLRHLVCWPTMGNHEGATSKGTNGVGPYFDAYVCPTRGEAGGVPTGPRRFILSTTGASTSSASTHTTWSAELPAPWPGGSSSIWIGPEPTGLSRSSTTRPTRKERETATAKSSSSKCALTSCPSSNPAEWTLC
jgi:hypothetical protein